MYKRSFVLFLFLAACGRQGCSAGEKITVLYRGPEQLAPTARVMRIDEAVGYVDQVLVDADKTQRVILVLRQASAVTDKDRFKPFDDDQGKKGFRVLPGGGKPLSVGAVVEADPTWSKREYYAAITTPGGITLPSGTPLPYPQALTRSPTPHLERIEKDFRKSIHREMEIKKKRSLVVDSGLLASYRVVEASIKGKSPREVKAILEGQGPSLKNDLQNAVDDARGQRDMATFRDTKELMKRLERLEMKTERALEKMDREAKKPKREPWVPPDFR